MLVIIGLKYKSVLWCFRLSSSSSPSLNLTHPKVIKLLTLLGLYTNDMVLSLNWYNHPCPFDIHFYMCLRHYFTDIKFYIYLCTLLCVYILLLLSCFGCSQYILLLNIIPSSFYHNHTI